MNVSTATKYVQCKLQRQQQKRMKEEENKFFNQVSPTGARAIALQ